MWQQTARTVNRTGVIHPRLCPDSAVMVWESGLASVREFVPVITQAASRTFICLRTCVAEFGNVDGAGGFDPFHHFGAARRHGTLAGLREFAAVHPHAGSAAVAAGILAGAKLHEIGRAGLAHGLRAGVVILICRKGRHGGERKNAYGD